jgi:hypothetical protein
MISPFWTFAGVLCGLLLVSVFYPPVHKVDEVPSPNTAKTFYASTGCVRFKTEEVPCASATKSLNFIASQ